MISNITNAQRKQYRKENIYIKEYHNCRDEFQRIKKMCNIASDNGRCWWIAQFLKATTSYRSKNGNYRR